MRHGGHRVVLSEVKVSQPNFTKAHGDRRFMAVSALLLHHHQGRDQKSRGEKRRNESNDKTTMRPIDRCNVTTLPQTYKFRIEGYFIHLPGEEWLGCCGFFTTVYATGMNASAALRQAALELARRTRSRKLREHKGAICRSAYVVTDLWEVDRATYEEKAGKDSGFTFYRVDKLAEISSFFRLLFIRWMRPHLLVDVRLES